MIRACFALAAAAIPMLAAGDPVAAVPEPSSVLLMASGLVAFGYVGSRKRRK
jgi:hypothetical protein